MDQPLAGAGAAAQVCDGHGDDDSVVRDAGRMVPIRQLKPADLQPSKVWMARKTSLAQVGRRHGSITRAYGCLRDQGDSRDMNEAADSKAVQEAGPRGSGESGDESDKQVDKPIEKRPQVEKRVSEREDKTMTTATPDPKPITAYCRVCGKPLTEDEARPAQGRSSARNTFRPRAGNHSPANGRSPAPRQRIAGAGVPAGLIPGVGAIYNGQYAKRHRARADPGLLITIVSSGNAGGLEPLVEC